MVGSVVEAAQMNLGVRIMKDPQPGKLPLDTICTITREDVECISLKPGKKPVNLPLNEELLKISLNQLNELTGLQPLPKAMEILQEYFDLHVRHKDRFFGNARFVRKVTEKVVRNQLLRMGSKLSKERTLEMMQTISVDDVKEFQRGMDSLQIRPLIGFTSGR